MDLSKAALSYLDNFSPKLPSFSPVELFLSGTDVIK